MPLIRNGRFVSDDWLRPAPEDKLPWYGKLILPRDRLSVEGPALLEAGHTLGVEITNDTNPEDLDAWLPQLTLIAIGFPKSAR